MNIGTLELPTGAALEREIEEIEVRSHDEFIRKIIAERMEIARNPKTVFISNEDAFSASHTRLIAKLTRQTNG
jgi:hypothetical protein